MIYRLFCVLFSLLIVAGCSDHHAQRQMQLKKWMEDNGKIKILSTTAMIDDLVRQIGDDYVDTQVLIQGDLDPHSYQLVKGDDEKLGFAQIIFYNGLGLEHGPSLQHYLFNNSKAISLGSHIDPAQVIYIGKQPDPHFWVDIALWSQTIPIITETLSQMEPAHAEEFQTNAKKLQEAMQKSDSTVREFMHKVPEEKRYLVTSHDAFNYFARAYLSKDGERENNTWEKRFAAPEGLSPESQLSTTDIQLIIDHVKKHHIEVIFPESNVSRDSIRKIVQAGKEQGLNLRMACCPLYADAMGPAGSEGDTYLKMMEYDAKMISKHMMEE